MKKFPVTSENGNEYLAHVNYYDSMFYGEDTLNVEIYIKQGKKLFGGDKFIEVSNIVFEKEDKLNTDIVGAVKKAVSNYETHLENRRKKKEEKEIRERIISQSEKEFEEWNGDCNES